MSDQGNWNQPSAPGAVGGEWNQPAGPENVPTPTPVTGYQPTPLPLPPGEAPRSGRRRTGLLITGGVLLVLALCGIVIGLAAWAVQGGPFSGFTSADEGEDAQILAAQWAGGGRYAVVEYLSTGRNATDSVVAWDRVSGKTTKLDGFRLVSTEPSSTEVWLTRAVKASGDSDDADSPWEDIEDGDSQSDGPGTAWVWDVASPEVKPAEVDNPEWEPWVGPSGVSAILNVEPNVGLWPDGLRFRHGADDVEADIPSQMESFRPVGWSPSGKYFAAVDANDWGDGEQVVCIFDATDGSMVSSYRVSLGGSSGGTELDGAAWDPVKDTLWVLRSVDGSGDQVKVSLVGLGVDGERTTLDHAPDAWSKSDESPTLIGADSRGVLVAVDGDDGDEIWRVSGGTAAKAGSLDSGDASVIAPDTFLERVGLLVENDDSDSGAVTAAVVDLNGTIVHTIWPSK